MIFPIPYASEIIIKRSSIFMWKIDTKIKDGYILTYEVMLQIFIGFEYEPPIVKFLLLHFVHQIAIHQFFESVFTSLPFLYIINAGWIEIGILKTSFPSPNTLEE